MEFERLIETERQNDELLHRARGEAAAIRKAAVDATERRQTSLAAEVAQMLHDSDQAIALRRTESLAGIADAARDAAARYDAVTEAQLRDAADALVGQLLGDGASP
jgi:hypothetical protein